MDTDTLEHNTYQSPDNPVGTAIRAIRTRLGLTQVKFSRMLSIQQNTLSRFETGDAKPCTKRLIQLLRWARANGEKGPLVAALEQRGISASELVTLFIATPSGSPVVHQTAMPETTVCSDKGVS